MMFMEESRKRKKFRIKLPVRRRDRYVFTDKKHPEKGVFSAALGLISLVTIIYAVVLSFKNGGQAQAKSAVAVLICIIYAIVGLVLGIMSRMERDIFRFFPHLGIILNSISLLFMGVLLFLAFM